MINRENYLLVKSHLRYLGEVEQLCPSSLDRYWSYLRHLLLWAGETRLNKSPSIRPIFPTYITSLSGRKEPQSLAAATQKKIVATAKRFFLWAKMHGYKDFTQLTMDWIETLRPARSIHSSSDHVYVTLEETVQLATFPVDPGDLAIRRDQAASAMLFLSGARAGAFASLPIEAVDVEARHISQWPDLGVRTKNRKKATTFLLPIPELLEVVAAWDDLVRSKLPPSAPWYASVDNRWGEQRLTSNAPVETRNQMLTKRLRNLFSRTGLSYKSAHKFRHGHAVYGLQHAQTMADYKAVSMNLMHNDIKVTDSIYAPILSNEVKDRIESLVKLPNTETEDELDAYFQTMSNEQLSRALVIIADRLSE